MTLEEPLATQLHHLHHHPRHRRHHYHRRRRLCSRICWQLNCGEGWLIFAGLVI